MVDTGVPDDAAAFRQFMLEAVGHFNALSVGSGLPTAGLHVYAEADFAYWTGLLVDVASPVLRDKPVTVTAGMDTMTISVNFDDKRSRYAARDELIFPFEMNRKKMQAFDSPLAFARGLWAGVREARDAAERAASAARDARSGNPARQKSEKFGILDSPKLLEIDLRGEPGPLGTACIYMDIDSFKPFNTKYGHTAVDAELLPEYQRLVAAAVSSHGFAYAEGGDEAVVVLPNATTEMAVAWADGFRTALVGRKFKIGGDQVELRISAGVSHADLGAERSALKERANAALLRAKADGKDRVYIESVEAPRPATQAEGILPNSVWNNLNKRMIEIVRARPGDLTARKICCLLGDAEGEAFLLLPGGVEKFDREADAARDPQLAKMLTYDLPRVQLALDKLVAEGRLSVEIGAGGGAFYDLGL